MSTYSVTLAQTVQIYGTVDVEASSYAEAIQKVHTDLKGNGSQYWDSVTEVSYDTASDARISQIEAECGETRDDIELQSEWTTHELDDILREFYDAY